MNHDETQLIYKNGCWGCLKSQQDPQEKYTCPKLQQHWEEYSQIEYGNKPN